MKLGSFDNDLTIKEESSKDGSSSYMIKVSVSTDLANAFTTIENDEIGRGRVENVIKDCMGFAQLFTAIEAFDNVYRICEKRILEDISSQELAGYLSMMKLHYKVAKLNVLGEALKDKKMIGLSRGESELIKKVVGYEVNKLYINNYVQLMNDYITKLEEKLGKM